MIARWITEAEAIGLRVGADVRGLAHVLVGETDLANCGRITPEPASAATRVCMDGRELPGRERHYVAVTGGHE